MSAVAIIQTAFIGDVVLATPLFEAARASCPYDTIVAVVRHGCDNVLGNNPFIDEIIVWDKHGGGRGLSGMRAIGKRLKALDVRLALVPHRSFRSSLTTVFSGAEKRIGFAKGGGSFFHTDRVEYRQGIHEVERNLMLAAAAGWESSGFRPSLFPDDRDRTIVNDMLGDSGKFCVFAPGSVWETKKWPLEYYIDAGAAFAQRGYSVVMSGGMDDADLCAVIGSRIPGSVTTCGLLTLRQSVELYRRAEFVLTGDSAPQHLAAAVDARVFSVFGPTVKHFGFWPYTDNGVVIEEFPKCRPCGIHGHRECPEKHHICMKSLTPDKVIDVIEKTMIN